MWKYRGNVPVQKDLLNFSTINYMPDSNTIVAVASDEGKDGFDEILKTLKIGELQNPPS